MTDFKMILNPYGGKNTFEKNGTPLTLIGQWGRYATLPVTEWLDRVFSAISLEANESYSLTVVGEAFERFLLGGLSSTHADCKDFCSDKFPTEITLEERKALVVGLAKKHGILWNEDEYDIPVFCKGQNVPVGMRKASFEEAFLYLPENDDEMLSSMMRLGGCRIFLTVSASPAVTAEDQKIIFKVAADEFTQLLSAVTARFREIPLIKDLIKRLRAKGLSPAEAELLLRAESVDEYFTVEDIPALELGTAYALRITSSSDTLLEKIRLEADDPTVLSVKGLEITAVGAGETELRCFSDRATLPFAVKRVQVYKTNYVHAIELQAPDTLAPEETGQLSITLFPKDADDANAVKILSSDSSILTVDEKGHFHAVGVGTVTVSVKSTRVTKEKTLRVLPNVTAFLLTPPITRLYVGEEERLTVQTKPNDVYDPSYTLRSTEPEVIEVSTRGNEHFLKAKSVGSAKIVCRANRGGHEESFTVRVESSFERRERITLHPLLGVSFLLLLLSWVLLFVGPLPCTLAAATSVLCAWISCARKRRSLRLVRTDELPLARELLRKNRFWAIVLVLFSLATVIAAHLIEF